MLERICQPKTKQKPSNGPTVKLPPAHSTNILARAVPIESLQTSVWLQMLVYAKNRVGKTRLAGEFDKPLLLISHDAKNNGGADTLRKVPGITVMQQGVHLRGTADVEALGRELIANNPFKTVVNDGLQSLEQTLLAEICGWEETANMLQFPKKGETPKVTKEQYIERSEKIRQVLRPFINLKGCHCLYLATERDHNAFKDYTPKLLQVGHSASLYGPSIGDGATLWLSDCCNWTCHLSIGPETKTIKKPKIVLKGKSPEMQDVVVETGGTVRRLRVKLHDNFLAGVNAPDDDLPEFLEAVTARELYEKVMALARGLAA